LKSFTGPRRVAENSHQPTREREREKPAPRRCQSSPTGAGFELGPEPTARQRADLEKFQVGG
jgi:hypothetical protein